MCRICEMYGGKGIWYQNPQNFAHQMYKLREPGGKPQEKSESGGSIGGSALKEAIEAKCDGNIERFNQIIAEINERDKVHATCHVLPLKDALAVLDISSPIAKMSCICRKRQRGWEEDGSNYSCLGLGTGMLKWERWPERYRGGVDFISVEEAKEWLTEWDRRGMVHIIMSEGQGFIGGICNCDYPDCLQIRHRLDYGINFTMTKAHYVAKVNYDVCNGCGVCVQRCQFGALKFEVTTEKASIDQMKCFGCGVCQTGCPRGAIELLDRMSLPGLREVW